MNSVSNGDSSPTSAPSIVNVECDPSDSSARASVS